MKEQTHLADSFELIERPTGNAWLNKTKPVWIVFYEAVQGVRASYYQAYRAVQPVPKGRYPWSIDNRRIGHADHGYPTLQAAMEAAL